MTAPVNNEQPARLTRQAPAKDLADHRMLGRGAHTIALRLLGHRAGILGERRHEQRYSVGRYSTVGKPMSKPACVQRRTVESPRPASLVLLDPDDHGHGISRT